MDINHHGGRAMPYGVPRLIAVSSKQNHLYSLLADYLHCRSTGGMPQKEGVMQLLKGKDL